MTTISLFDLELVTGGAGKEPAVKESTRTSACVRGAVDGALAGAAGGAGALTYAALSGPLTPLAAGVLVGGGAGVGALVGCGQGVWERYKARNPRE